MKTKDHILTAIFLISALCLSAQPYAELRTFSIRDGLASDAITAMTQSPDGTMWFATMNGLCNYDGYVFTTFRDDKAADEMLTTNHLSKVKANAYNNIWFITRDHRLYLFDTHVCQFFDVGDRMSRKYDHDFSFRGIFTLKNGITWVTCDDASQGVFRIDDADISHADAFTKIDMKALGIEGAIVNDILLDDNGDEWIINNRATMLYGRAFNNKVAYELSEQMGSRIFFASQRSGQLACYQSGASALTPLNIPGTGKINCMASIADSLLIIGTDAGLTAYNTALGTSQHFGQPTDDIRKLMVDGKQRVWAVNSRNDILMYTPDLATANRLQLPVALPTTTFNEDIFMVESYGCVWIVPTNRPLCYYDEGARRLSISYPSFSVAQPIQIPTLRRIFLDSQQNLWNLTTNNKLSLITFGNHNVHYHEVAKGHNVRAVYFDDNRRLWVGDDDGIISLYDHEFNRLGYLAPNGSVQTAPTTFSGRIFTFFKDSKGRFWIGTKGNGLYMLDPSGVHHFGYDAANAQSISSNDIYSIDEDERHNLWIGTFDGGLNLLQTSASGQISFANHRSGLTSYPIGDNSRIRRITHDGHGTVLLSTTNGLVTFSSEFSQPSAIKFFSSRHVKGQPSSLLANDVSQTLVARDGRIYVVSIGGGIQTIAADNLLQDQLQFSTQKQMSTHEGIVLSMTEDNEGRIWLERDESINSYDPATSTLIRYDRGVIDGNIDFSEAQPTRSPDGRHIVMGTMGGFVDFEPERLKANSEAPAIIFTSVQFHGSTEATPILHTAELNVPYNKRNLTINFSALDFADEDNIRYAYRIEGIDKDWNYLLNGHGVSFNNLPAGHLKLQVKSTNRYGMWVDNVETLSIYAHPNFWETPWAWILYLLILLSLIALGIYVYRMRMLASMERRMSNMRTRFFTEIGHKLRTPLTLIGGPVTEVLETAQLTDDEREHLEKVQRNSRNMLELVNKMLDRSQDDNYFVDDPEAPVFAGNASFISATADTQQHQDIKLMVVEDNDDLRSFLVSILQNDYTLIEAENGRIGLDKALKELPDFIITDVMMPEMDGLTMVQHIKKNADICHIPIIVLSAKASLEDRLQGLKAGIDDYITKPFSATYLKQRIENIIGQRRMLQQTLLTQLGESIGADRTRNIERFRLDEPQIVDADQEMMESLMKYIESRIDDQDLKIEELADAVNLGRTVFYGKIRSIVGMSPSDFLRHVRLQRAEELISKSQMNFSQIAYSVGFSDPKYFTKCFKKETGMTPSEYRQKAKEPTEESAEE